MHLAFNLYFLWAVGRVTEQIFGPVAYALVYFGSGLLASMVSCAVQPGIVSVGASGALFGVFGAFVGFTYRRRGLLPPEFVSSVRRNAMILVGINLVIGFAVPGIDLAAHIGGLVAGLAIGYAIARLAEKPVESKAEARKVKARAIGLTALATIVILVAGGLGLPRYDNPLPVLDAAVERDTAIAAEYEESADVETRIELLEQRLIPQTRAMHAQLAALERVPGHYREFVDAYARYFDLRTQAFERELDGLRRQDPDALAEAKQLHAEAVAARESL